ncbi:dnaJ homolog subfamily B member 3-like [Phoenix dactylifera]|uniref:DnaJ homolog subfamily B member 3-like n=1 Tax=Phoenix dactylifera TaxID=42345 RepID=A0A8B7CP60_PHODC|nr:dnaJ homolog subfamily B member 3-like [Phoenix dactylifera]
MVSERRCGGFAMAAGGEKTGDFYAVLGLNKECSDAELRDAYKKLAMRWHPDKCSASGNSKCVEEAKEKFQEIQEAYTVLSDSNKRFLYDVGVYDSDDDHNGMGEFLGEMAQMMSQTKPNDKDHETFEELQQLFVEMFQDDLDAGFGGPFPSQASSDGYDHLFPSSSSSSSPSSDGANGSNKRGSAAVNSGTAKLGEGGAGAAGFCFGYNDSRQPSKGGSKRRNGRKQKVSSKHDVSSHDAEISA